MDLPRRRRKKEKEEKKKNRRRRRREEEEEEEVEKGFWRYFISFILINKLSNVFRIRKKYGFNKLLLI